MCSSGHSCPCFCTEDIYLDSPLTVHVPHAVETLLNSHRSQHLSSSRLANLEVTLLSKTNLTIKHVNILNLDIYLPEVKSEDEILDHDCLIDLHVLLSLQEAIRETLLEGVDFD